MRHIGKTQYEPRKSKEAQIKLKIVKNVKESGVSRPV